MKDLVVYGTPVSPFVRKVEAVLRTQGVARDFEEAKKTHAGIVDNLSSCQQMLGKLVPEKLDLS